MKKRKRSKKKLFKLIMTVAIIAVIRNSLMRQALQTYQPPPEGEEI